MPEIAEVEINRRNLDRWTRGRALLGLELADPVRFFGEPSVAVGREILGWRRHGKVLQADLEGGVVLQSHLGMTGQWLRDPAPGRRGLRVVLSLAEGPHVRRVALMDPRRFGRTSVFGPGDPEAASTLARLGPDPLLSPMDGPALGRRLGRGRTPLKTRLMDQSVVSGLGNIAAIEIAHRAGVHPHTPVARLSPDQHERLAMSTAAHIAYVLDVETGDEIAYLGSANAHNPFVCYGRADQPCGRCREPIARGSLSGRPSFWCPTCQPS